MPELPEVQTTVSGLQKILPSLIIKNVWTDFHKNSKQTTKKETIKNPVYFKKFKKEIVSQKIINVQRRGKNILIHLSNQKTILIHMKMTGHLLYGDYRYYKKEDIWKALGDKYLENPFSRFIHLVFSLSNGKYLAFSDMRKFAKVTLLETFAIENSSDLKKIGPEPLEKNFSFEDFQKRIILKPKSKIKQVLMNQEIIAGIGNIYSDEILWWSAIHPEERAGNIPKLKLKKAFKFMRTLLVKGIILKGDSTSDYRNIDGKKGSFQKHHRAYRLTKSKCTQKKCRGIIKRIKVGGRSAHYCSSHQKKLHI